MSDQPETSPELAPVIALHDTVLAADRAIVDALALVALLRQRRAGLDTRLAELQRQRPAAPIGLDDQLVAALAADHAAELHDDVVADAVQQRAAVQEAMRGWEAKVSIVQQAMPTVDTHIASAVSDVVACRRARHLAWRNFVHGAQTYFVGRLRAAVAQIRDDVLMPLVAFTNTEDYEPGDVDRVMQGRAIVPTKMHRISRDTVVAVAGYRRNRGVDQPYDDVLFSAADAGSYKNGALWKADIERFRATLAAPAEGRD